MTVILNKLKNVTHCGFFRFRNFIILPYFAAKLDKRLSYRVAFQNQSTHSITEFELSRAAVLCFVTVIAKVLHCSYVLLNVQFLLRT